MKKPSPFPRPPREPFLPILRELARCYQAFERYSSRHIRGLGLTPSQFDIIATLGNTPGMSCKELGERTLITKGTLTGVIDRLESRGLLRRHDATHDRRSFTVALTPAGEREFARVFPAHLQFLRPAFGGFSGADLGDLEQRLARLRERIEGAESRAELAS
jgi:DNA-binding MarR family transcriptional regulator